ncbi:DinI-like family protein [Citrobacter sp. Ce129]|nr:DinI-like family protein [Citrobacter sp. Ce129]MDM3270866.1 DinI family protein [Citrobacter sp. Ce129]
MECADASKHKIEQISRSVQEMFEEADMWMNDFLNL